jgi:hypothetical protein
MTDEEIIMQQIELIRESIRHDWEKLATENLTFDQRKAIREDLQMCISALKDLRARLGQLSKRPS